MVKNQHLMGAVRYFQVQAVRKILRQISRFLLYSLTPWYGRLLSLHRLELSFSMRKHILGLVEMGIHLHQRESCLYLDALIVHKLLHPMSTNVRFLGQKLYVLSLRQFALLTLSLKPK